MPKWDAQGNIVTDTPQKWDAQGNASSEVAAPKPSGGGLIPPESFTGMSADKMAYESQPYEGESPLHAGVRVGALGVVNDVGKGLSALSHPLNLAMAAASLHPVGRAIIAPYAAITGGKQMLESKPNIHYEGITERPETLGFSADPDETQKLLLGGSGVAGGMAGMKESAPVYSKAAQATLRAPGAIQEYALTHPNTVKTVGAAVGTGVGHLIGEGPLGEVGGVFAGSKLGGHLVSSAEESAIESVIAGKRSPQSIPARLQTTLAGRLSAQERAYADLMARTGKSIEELKVPTGMREGVKRIFEEESRKTANVPNLIQTPEEIAASERRGQAFGVVKNQLRPEASARGMAYAAGQSESNWVPSKRSIETSTSKSSRIFPRIRP